ncbi:MAG: glycosyltransferase [Caldimonas sp.]
MTPASPGLNTTDGAAGRSVDAALERVPAHELALLLAFVDDLAHSAGAAPLHRSYISFLNRDHVSPASKVAAGFINLRWRQALQSGPSGGAARLDEDLAAWRRTLQARLGTSDAGEPTPLPAGTGAGMLMSGLDDGPFIQLAYEVMLGRGCQPHELRRWQTRLAEPTRREALLGELLQEAAQTAELDRSRQADRERAFHVMGTGQRVTLADWQARATQQLPAEPAAAFPQRFHIKGPPRVLVSAVTSLYRGADYIERFMDNITGQTCFRDYAELVIVDADSPDAERAVIERHLRHRPNIKYLRINHRIGIYDAWNIAVAASAGDYLTSTNVDDLRRADSFEQQAAVLDTLPFVDVVYQDFFYSLDATLSFEQAAAFGYRSELPLVTPHGLMAFNSPHNAPMWRRRLHDELGLFDTGFKSAGDYEFWVRCIVAGKTFFKLNAPHVVYYQNPEGISTRPDTRGHEEARMIHKRYGRQLVSDNLVMPFDSFRALVAPDLPAPAGGGPGDRHALVQSALREAALAARRTRPS